MLGGGRHCSFKKHSQGGPHGDGDMGVRRQERAQRDIARPVRLEQRAPGQRMRRAEGSQVLARRALQGLVRTLALL